MKAILISIKPKWVEKILNGEKTIEIRKTCPARFKNLKPYECANPIDVYIYCTKENNNVLDHEGKDYFTFNPNKHLIGKLIKDYQGLNGKVVAKFTLKRVEEIHSYLEPEQWYKTNDTSGNDLLKKSCLFFKELDEYLLSGDGYAWHIDNLEIFDEPQELEKYMHIKHYILGRTYVPQSWCYIEV